MRAALLELLVPSVCPACDVPRGSGVPLLCSRCRHRLRPLHELGGVATVLAYEGCGAELIRRFKYAGRRDALAVLLPALSARAADLSREHRLDALVPVPRHVSRVRELGADPVHDLGRAVARRLGLPLLGRALRRTRASSPQTSLAPLERARNVAGSFRTGRSLVAGRRVLLLDDVTTTGATLQAARRELLERGEARAVVPLAAAGTQVLPDLLPAAL
ncbi:MAG: ComF family protein [Myxococcota bacterium]